MQKWNILSEIRRRIRDKSNFENMSSIGKSERGSDKIIVIFYTAKLIPRIDWDVAFFDI